MEHVPFSEFIAEQDQRHFIEHVYNPKWNVLMSINQEHEELIAKDPRDYKEELELLQILKTGLEDLLQVVVAFRQDMVGDTSMKRRQQLVQCYEWIRSWLLIVGQTITITMGQVNQDQGGGNADSPTDNL
ncbi:uncharacterized protein LOC143292835 [Babylonia areolata]|uniref:uncharacterized protein LOC143292835 n=1 Tax=Babylonia areolata TaxID=304850 RepID=UPI003FCF8D65